MKIIAVICVYNEEMVIENCIKNAREQGLDVIIIDNGCTDKTIDICKRLNAPVFEHFTKKFDCNEIIRWGVRKAKEIGCDWYVIKDADDIFETYDGRKIVDVVNEADRSGYNCMRFDMYEFWPTEEDNKSIKDFIKRIHYYSYYNSRYSKMVKNSSEIILDNPHYALGEIKESPVRLVFRHYKFVSLEHGRKKVQTRMQRILAKKDICTQYKKITNESRFYVLEKDVYSKLYRFNGTWIKKRVFDGWRGSEVIPIFIITCDRLEVLKKSIESYYAFIETPFEIVFIDFGSTYEPTVSFLKHLEYEGFKVYWEDKIIHNVDFNRVDEAIQNYFETHPKSNYVVTDPDIALDNTKGDILDVFSRLLAILPHTSVIGPMLRIDDIPDYYPQKKTLISNSLHADIHKREIKEYQYQGKIIQCVHAPIDTTFGLYRAGGHWHRLNHGRRVLAPYAARHLSWYLDPENQTQDQIYYVKHASSELGNWSMWGRDK